MIKTISYCGRSCGKNDPKFPFSMEIHFSPPEWMQFTFIMLYGENEVIVVKSKTVKKLVKYIDLDIAKHSRFLWAKISGPDGKLLLQKDRNKPWLELDNNEKPQLDHKL